LWGAKCAGGVPGGQDAAAATARPLPLARGPFWQSARALHEISAQCRHVRYQRAAASARRRGVPGDVCG